MIRRPICLEFDLLGIRFCYYVNNGVLKDAIAHAVAPRRYILCRVYCFAVIEGHIIALFTESLLTQLESTLASRRNLFLRLV